MIPEFKVGDGVSYGYGSDSYPYTVRRVSPSGHKLWVSRDRPFKGVFVPQDVPEKDWVCFTRRRDGQYREANKSYARQHALTKGREFYLDPSF